MSSEPIDAASETKPLRLWPGVVIVALQWLARFVIPAFAPDFLLYGVMGGLVGGLLIVLWWAFFSRAPWRERLGGIALMAIALVATPLILHVSIATGNMGMMFPLYAIPVLSLAFVAWAAASRSLASGPRWATMAAAIFLSCAVWALFRTGGNTTDLDHDFAWRWSATPEERLLAEGDEPTARRSTPAAHGEGLAETTPAWPGFRGPARDSILSGMRIATDWAATPPSELWRRPVGPGWSSFAVDGEVFYTQEQRGEDEVVACYRMATGEPVWRHSDPVRFWESVGGAGPRGTPTLSGGRVYTLGGTGLLNVLDAADGSVVWSRDAAADTGAELPTWAFSGSPLVLGDQVVVAASGALIAYDLASGEPRWKGPAGGEGYSSPHLLTLDGVEQILQLNGDGLVGVAPADGTLLWQHEWSGYPIVQPALTADGDILISVTSQSGTRRVAVENGAGGWTTEELWTSNGLKSYFNDFVVHKGHAYGFDGNILAAIDVADGERRWKGGRYGGGQLILLADQDLLLVLSEKGQLALVSAKPDGFEELAKVPAIEGKTWNHPVLVDDLLLVRNAEEMAAFRLARSES
ncbi:MAG: PQQ-binding-like beta-propeller repeat protein [Acidobacteriota bacterium]